MTPTQQDEKESEEGGIPGGGGQRSFFTLVGETTHISEGFGSYKVIFRTKFQWENFVSKMTERLSPSLLSATFPGLVISNLVTTEEKLGRGAYATVFAAEWNGTVCAAKRLHDILLEDESPGGAKKIISNFEAECLTWSKLRHPGVVQFWGCIWIADLACRCS